MKKSANTRATILQQAFELIYKKGYQSTSIDEIIATTKVTKGAFYYHFKNKKQMGIAVIKEVIQSKTIYFSVSFLSSSTSLHHSLYTMIEELLLHNSFLTIEYGCPLANLIQEMSPLDNDFKEALDEAKSLWTNAIATSITKEQQNNTFNSNINAEEVANFIIASYWGTRALGKLSNKIDTYTHHLNQLKLYLTSLKQS
ncbi:TetR/AcrR family transcriptional regulator [Tenacibaculum sp. 1_MG-2023]|uniref:TetR/AcrR family transcriptional regulator n=1 Tax=Tenacibaculum sp. 1_MG-2023 TaxID=3062653 RepID=UPI0026E3ABD5|nr:TetR/AcrR family transcriptional regulator [Tenacibaculum sp. 1_MG-2023]MDO6676562.1 TetR/AcrR family transcriptional regulator [Tenacibaculum sp. 1_MG-2023]